MRFTISGDEMSDEQIQSMQELLAGVYIQNLRIYDVLMSMLAIQNPGRADELEKLHSEGKILGPDPALNVED